MTDVDWDDCWPEFDNSEEPKLGFVHEDGGVCDDIGLPNDWIETGMMDDSTEMWFAHW